MRIHYLQHVPFEDLANIQDWAVDKGHILSRTSLFENVCFPEMSDFDWLIVLGGPMNVDQDDIYPWLTEEKAFIKKTIESGKVVLGICLGAQLVARVLGAEVTRNEHKEIGWFPVEMTSAASDSKVFKVLPDSMMVFQWHGDTFEIPQGALRLLGSEACLNQAFEYQERVIGLQFHLEYSRHSIEQLIRNCGEEITAEKYIQSVEYMMAQFDYLQEAGSNLWKLLDRLEQYYNG
ncbi:MAG: type 1 glutamine amidotransferase [Candidatus Saccharibacteria bacterium]